jgi:hypothetical protein
MGEVRSIPALEAWNRVAGKPDARWSSTLSSFNQPVFAIQHTAKFSLSMSDKFFCIGSCFARNIEEHLICQGAQMLSYQVVSPKLECPSRPAGMVNKFTTHSILQEIRWVSSPPADLTCYFSRIQDGWKDLQLKPNLPPVSYERVAERRHYLMTDYFSRLRAASIVIITLGLTEVWWDCSSELYLNATPSLWSVHREPDRYELHVTDTAANLEALEEIRKELKLLNTAIRVIVTVSPVPFHVTFTGQPVAVANMASKCTLRAAAEMFARKHDDVDYFPSFEMISLSNRNSVFLSDCLHVSNSAVRAVIREFMRAYAGEYHDPPDDFNEKDYLAANGDVEALLRLGSLESGFAHWIASGKREGRPIRIDR